MEPNPPPDVNLTPATPGMAGPFLRNALCSCPHCDVLDEYPPEGVYCPHCRNLLGQGLVIATVPGPHEAHAASTSL
jgi:hypothetical protein